MYIILNKRYGAITARLSSFATICKLQLRNGVENIFILCHLHIFTDNNRIVFIYFNAVRLNMVNQLDLTSSHSPEK